MEKFSEINYFEHNLGQEEERMSYHTNPQTNDLMQFGHQSPLHR